MFDKLCEILGDELERQENILAQCRAQQEAVRIRNVADLEARSVALQILFREVVATEPRRQETLRRVAVELGLESANPSLTEVVLAAPAPWNGRLRHLQLRLRETLRQSRDMARENAILLRRSLRVVGRCLQVFQVEAPYASGRYSPSGQKTAAAQVPALLVNQRG